MSEYMYDSGGVPRALGAPSGPAQLDETGKLLVSQLPNGLGGGLPIGTTANTVAAGNDPRIVAAIQPGTGFASTGSLASRALADRFAGPSVDVRDFCPAVHTTFGSGTSKPLSAYYGTLAAAQAVFPLATALTQETDWCVVQLAHMVRRAAGGRIMLPPGTFRANFTLLLDSSKIELWGSGPGTLVDASGCAAGTPAIAVSGAAGDGPGYSFANYRVLLADFAIKGANTGSNQYGLTAPGTPGQSATGFVPGSVAIYTENVFGFTFRRVSFSFFDVTTTWGNNAWSALLDECTATSCNKGAVWSQQPTRYNSGECIRWRGGNYSNNNHNIWVDASTADGGMTGGSFFVDGGSNDYPFVDFVNYRGASPGTGYSQNHLHLSNCHLESTGATTGTEPPIYFENGALHLDGLAVQWSDGIAPRGLITSNINVDNNFGKVRCRSITMLGMFVPLGVNPTANPYNSFDIDAEGCVGQDNTPLVMFQNAGGPMPQPKNLTSLLVTSNQTAPLHWMGKRISCFGTPTITLPSGYLNFAAIEFVQVADGTITFAAGANASVSVPSGGSPTLSTVGGTVLAVYVFGTWHLYSGAGSAASTPAIRVVTASGPVTLTAADGTVKVKKTASEATTVALEASPPAGTTHVITDGKGDAAANPITLTAPSGATINGAGTFAISANRGSATIQYDGTDWSII